MSPSSPARRGAHRAPSRSGATRASREGARRVPTRPIVLIAVAGLAGGAGIVPLLSGASQAAVPQAAQASGRGSGAAIGATSYGIPGGALFVATNGKDTAAGTKSAPLRTLAQAIRKAKSGATIVIRGGNYHESVIIPKGKALTIQAYPKERVWFDGAKRVRNIANENGLWVARNWTVKFDSSPTYAWGAPDDTRKYWKFINPAYPMAAHPDQLWIGGVEQRQVGSKSQVKAGTFYVDRGASKIYMGTRPGSQAVEASALARAVLVSGSGSTIRGIGFRRYAPSVPHQGAITAYSSKLTLDHVAINDSATAGLGLFGSGHKISNVTIRGAGQMGVQGRFADGTTLTNLRILNANDQHFNPVPSACAIKFTATRGITLKNSLIRGTTGNGFWMDESSYDMNVIGNDIENSSGRGIFMELSSKGFVANNRVVGSGEFQFTAKNTDRVTVWNNNFVGNTIPLQVAQDERSPSKNSYALDPRRPKPDREMTWIVKDIVVKNNVFQATSGSNRLWSVEDLRSKSSAESMNVAANGNVYSQPKAGTPSWVVVWAKAGTNPRVFTTLKDFQSATGQDKQGLSVVGSSALDGVANVTRTVQSKAGSHAQPLPADVASRVGRSAGERHLGAWR